MCVCASYSSIWNNIDLWYNTFKSPGLHHTTHDSWFCDKKDNLIQLFKHPSFYDDRRPIVWQLPQMNKWNTGENRPICFQQQRFEISVIFEFRLKNLNGVRRRRKKKTEIYLKFMRCEVKVESANPSMRSRTRIKTEKANIDVRFILIHPDNSAYCHYHHPVICIFAPHTGQSFVVDAHALHSVQWLHGGTIELVLEDWQSTHGAALSFWKKKQRNQFLLHVQYFNESECPRWKKEQDWPTLETHTAEGLSWNIDNLFGMSNQDFRTEVLIRPLTPLLPKFCT